MSDTTPSSSGRTTRSKSKQAKTVESLCVAPARKPSYSDVRDASSREPPKGILCPGAEQPTLSHLQLQVLLSFLKTMSETLRQSFLDSRQTVPVLVFSRKFDSITQEGPSCGMVAMAMLARMLGKEEVATEVIVEHAREKGYTKCGELFSAQNARAMANDLLGTIATVEEVSDDPWTVCQCLIDHAILFCYDSKEEQPIRMNGHHAHWALITGFALVFHEELTPQQQEVLHSYKTEGTKDESVRSALREALKMLSKQSPPYPAVYVLGRTGTSSKVVCWQWSEMVASSRQLREFKTWVRSPDFVLPPEGMAEALSGKFVQVEVPQEVAAFQVGSHDVAFGELELLSEEKK